MISLSLSFDSNIVSSIIIISVTIISQYVFNFLTNTLKKITG